MVNGQVRVPRSTVAELIEFGENYDPRIWRLCYPRSYQVSSIYASPKQLAGELVAIYAVYPSRKQMPLHEQGMLAQAILGAAGLVQLRVPIFFVAPDLLRAVQLSIPPVDLDWVNLHLPFESAAFALPRGSLSHPEHGEISYVWYSRMRKGMPFPRFGEAKYHGIAEDDLFLVRGTCAEAKEAPSFQRLIAHSEAPTLDLKDHHAVVGKAGFGVTDEDSDVVSAITTLIFSLVFAMNARRGLWEHGRPTGKTAKSGVEFWTPNIIGKGYVLKGHQTGAHAGTSPRMHWRRGHMRQQPFGEGRRLRREQWIEPSLIAAESKEHE
jgi:hypothetical protein